METVSHIILWILVLMLTALSIQRKTQKTEMPMPKPMMLFQSEHGAALGERFPITVFRSLDQEEIRIQEDGKHTILLITSPLCSACKELYPAIMPFVQKYGSAYRVITIMLDDAEQTKSLVLSHRITSPVVFLNKDELDKTETKLYPFGYLLSPEGTVLSKGIVGNADQLELLRTWKPTPGKAA